MTNVTHRSSLNGTPACGTAGRVRISTTGTVVTCEACNVQPDRAAIMRSIEAAAARSAKRWTAE